MSPVILVLGAGPNIEQAVARIFASMSITADFFKPEQVTKVRKTLGIPSVVVYIGKSPHPRILAEYLLKTRTSHSWGFDDLSSEYWSWQVSTETWPSTPLVSSSQLNKLGFKELPADAASAGSGKSASAHEMKAAATAYQDRGFKYHYVDERKADGSAKYKFDGDAHGKIFAKLAEAKAQGPWLQTFIKDVGYKDFEGLHRLWSLLNFEAWLRALSLLCLETATYFIIMHGSKRLVAKIGILQKRFVRPSEPGRCSTDSLCI